MFHAQFHSQCATVELQNTFNEHLEVLQTRPPPATAWQVFYSLTGLKLQRLQRGIVVHAFRAVTLNFTD
ncbi:MAG: hypothetical protein CBB71_00430 [Rhodopirellula sp. TMED11]|nr:MAG: hypothetical protein CBB71_00430 [Rhodopirellula sp. TMED11]